MCAFIVDIIFTATLQWWPGHGKIRNASELKCDNYGKSRDKQVAVSSSTVSWCAGRAPLYCAGELCRIN